MAGDVALANQVTAGVQPPEPIGQAENRLATAEDLSEEELQELHEHYRQRAEDALGHLNRRRDDKRGR